MEESFYNLDYINLNGNWIHSTAIVADNVVMGKGNIIMPHVVIGEAGFFKGNDAPEGNIIIGDNNKIGNNVCIMAGSEGETIIGNDNNIMNLVNIGHNTVIGDRTIIGAGTIIPGYVTIENYVNMGINATVNNRLKIKEGCMIGHGAVITSNTHPWGTYAGNPAKSLGFNSVGADRNNITDAYDKWLKLES